MRLPNGYGSVYKMSGKRRRPYAAVIVHGWDDEGRAKRKYLGYYPTKKDALTALANYNAKPYKIEDHGITLAGLWEKWLGYRKERGKNVPRNYHAAFNRLAPFYEKPFVDLTTLQIQSLIDACDKPPSARMIKVVSKVIDNFMCLYIIGSTCIIKFLQVISMQDARTLSIETDVNNVYPLRTKKGPRSEAPFFSSFSLSEIPSRDIISISVREENLRNEIENDFEEECKVSPSHSRKLWKFHLFHFLS